MEVLDMDSSSPSTLGALIRELRLSKGWSQEYLVEKSNLSTRTIQRIEAEETERPNAATLRCLATAFAIDVDVLKEACRNKRAADTKWDTELKDSAGPPVDKPEEQPRPAMQPRPLGAQSGGETDLELSLRTLPTPPQRPKGILTRRIWAIVCSVILVGALAAGSSFIAGTPLWELFHTAPVTLPTVAWGPARTIMCGDLFNPSAQNPTTNIATCTLTSDGHTTLSFRMLQAGYPELDVKEGRGPSGPTYKVTLQMNLSPTAGVPHIAGCIVMDTSPNEAIGEVVCVHSNGFIEVLDAATMGSGSTTKHLADGAVTIDDPANVPVVVERVDNHLFISVANQVIDPVTCTATGNIGFMVVGTPQGSIQMSDIELT
jgi:transcriptional regulator with XRE-family HTH domain